jgi:outer membrane protein OmpA-like peptidoglycan-associated protein
LTLPTGDEDQFLGDDGVMGGGQLVVDRWIHPRHYLAMNGGVRFRPNEVILNLDVDHEVQASIGYQFVINEGRTWRLFSELYGSTPMKDFLSNEEESPLEALFGAKASWMENRLHLTVAVGRGVNNGYGAPDARYFAGLTFKPGKRQEALPVEQPVAPVVNPTPVTVAPVKAAPAVEALSYGKIEVAPIFFDNNKATIKESSFVILDNLVKTLMEHPEVTKLRIEGHTDNRGAAGYNLSLSDQRAVSVKKYLIEYGVVPERLESKGFGLTQPIDTNETIAGRLKNRRVDFIISEINGKSKQP